MLSSSCHNSLSVPATLKVILASPSSCLNCSTGCSNVEWWHCGVRNCYVCRFMISSSRSIICSGWSHTIWTSLNGCKYCPTLTNISCVYLKALYTLSVPMASLCRLMRAIIMPWFSVDTRATGGFCDPGIAVDQAHLPAPFVGIDFGGGRSRGFTHN